MNKKKYPALVLIGALMIALFFLPGCKKDTNVQPPPEEPQSEQPADIIDEASAITSINEKSAVRIAAAGVEIYRQIMQGGYTDIKEARTADIGGKEYFILPENLSTMSKLHHHMEKIFTSDAVDAFILQSGISENDGSLILPCAAVENKLDWRNSMASWVTGEGSKIEYELKVPYSENNDVEFAPVIVDYEKVGEFWRISTPPSDMR